MRKLLLLATLALPLAGCATPYTQACQDGDDAACDNDAAYREQRVAAIQASTDALAASMAVSAAIIRARQFQGYAYPAPQPQQCVGQFNGPGVLPMITMQCQ